MYPGSATPGDGVCDLIGNVWEWTLDPYKDADDAYWMVGGAYWDEAQSISAARSWPSAWFPWIDDSGFRVVAVPVLS